MRIIQFAAGRMARISFGVLATTLLIVAAPADATAKHHGHIARHHRAHPLIQVLAQDAAPPAATLGAMRYYGGPKSPMWREVR
jgi:hypothetical protein